MIADFSGFSLPPKLLQSLARMQFHQPTPIQAKSIPLVMEGRDILGSAQTGTGKTGAFGIPLIAKLMEDPVAVALILTPTRELAVQVMAAMQQLIPVPTIKTAVLIGGEAMPKQFHQLHAHPRLIVGTPGRVNDHLARGSLKLNNVRHIVLDETDRMLDMGFGIQIDKILTHVPLERQTLLFSATLPREIIRLSAKYLNNPERVSVGSTTMAAPKIKQDVIQTSDAEKADHLLTLLGEVQGSTIIFVKTKYGAEKMADRLGKQGHRANAIHGDLRQNRRDKVIQGFRDKKFAILVATDIAARGLDVPHIETVINYDLPQCPEDFIHRIGRTARAGAEGRAISFVAPSERGKWRAIEDLMNPREGKSERGEGEGRRDRNRRNDKDGRGEKRKTFDRPFRSKDSDRPVKSDRSVEDRNQAEPRGGRGDRPDFAAGDRGGRTFKKFGDNPRPDHKKKYEDRSHDSKPSFDKKDSFRGHEKRAEDKREYKPWDDGSSYRKKSFQGEGKDRQDRSDRPDRDDKPKYRDGKRIDRSRPSSKPKFGEGSHAGDKNAQTKKPQAKRGPERERQVMDASSDRPKKRFGDSRPQRGTEGRGTKDSGKRYPSSRRA